MNATWKQPQMATCTAELVGNSEAIKAVRALVDRVANSSASVLITGPSGSGKEIVAQSLHQRSSRAAKAFVTVNCAAIPRELLESEIFGHEAGSFTGAVKIRRGRFEAADGGTLFLDEIGDMPSDMQVKLLRILESRVVERVGSTSGVRVDVRLVAATNVDLEAAIAAQRFREDLFYRLNVIEIRLSPLSERPDDIAPLLDFFASGGSSDPRVQFTAAAIDWLHTQPWRGNVRELRNFVDRAAALHAGETIDRNVAQDLMSSDRQHATPSLLTPQRDIFPMSEQSTAMPLAHHQVSQQQSRQQTQAQPWLDTPVVQQPVAQWLHGSRTAVQPIQRSNPMEGTPIDLKALLNEFEQSHIERALENAAGGVAASARMLGIHRTTLIEKMRRLNICWPLIANGA